MVKFLGPYLECNNFIVRSDNDVLRWVMKTLADPCGHITRWRLILTDSVFEVKYRP